MSSGGDVWIMAFANQALTRLTFTTTPEYNPVWTPDSRHVLFDSREPGSIQIVRKAADGNRHAGGRPPDVWISRIDLSRRKVPSSTTRPAPCQSRCPCR